MTTLSSRASCRNPCGGPAAELARIAGALDKEAALIHKAANVLERRNLVP